MKKITLLFALLTVFFANAQWTSNTAANTLVASSRPTGTQSIGTTNGKTYVVFWKSVETPNHFELRVQLLDADGNQQFGPDGMLISDAIPMSTYTVIWTLSIDAKNNLYVAVTGTGEGTPSLVYKINTLGQQVWANPVTINGAYVPRVLPLPNDDVLISYMPLTGKGKIQRYNANGAAIWDNPIDINSSSAYATNNTVVANMYTHTDGDFTVVFHTRLGSGISSLLFAQRYDGEGTAQWAQPAQLASMETAYNTEYSGTQDGDVIYYGYSLSHDMRFDSYVQRINPDGTTPWGINGKDFDTHMTYFEMNTQIAFEEGSPYIWAICRYAPSSQGMAGEFVQKFDKATGARLFTENAKQVFPIDAQFRNHAGALYLINDMPVFISKSGFDNGASPVTLNATFLNENGDFILENQVLPVATFAASKGSGTFNKPVNNQAVVVFVEEKNNDEPRIYAQNFSTAVVCDLTTVDLADVTSACAINLSGLTVPSLTDDCGNTIVPTTDAAFPITAVGTTPITWTYTTLSGEVMTETQNIIITGIDTTAPVLVVQNISAQVNEDGNAAVTAIMFNNGSTDDCGDNGVASWTWTMSPDSFTCENLGEQTVTITATDASGNVSTATATLTITDPNNYCDTAAVSDFNSQAFAVYPNPASDVVYIRPATGTTINGVNVYSVIGQKLFSTKANASGELTVSLSQLQAGTYMINVETSNGTFTKQIIKN